MILSLWKYNITRKKIYKILFRVIHDSENVFLSLDTSEASNLKINK